VNVVGWHGRFSLVGCFPFPGLAARYTRRSERRRHRFLGGPHAGRCNRRDAGEPNRRKNRH
jgi:hypothetical protein